MNTYKVAFTDGSLDELIEASKFCADSGAFVFKETRQECKVVFSKLVKVIPMHRVKDITVEES